ncbi:MAG: peptidylprolyl isomerase [Bacteroidales bacterium]|nr:peptidylprolyl isomerase [Bacteroidales bacterium]
MLNILKSIPIKKTGIISTIIVLSIFILSSCSLLKHGINKKTLLTIDNEEITVGEFLNVYNKNNVQGDVIDKKSMEDYLDLFINFRLKVKEAKELGMDTIKEFVDELDGYRTQLIKPFFIDEKTNENLLIEASERKLIDIRASHILIKVQENASPADTLIAYNKIFELKERIKNGESFEEIAAEFSDDPTARDMEGIPGRRAARKGNKGDLGYFSVFDMLYSFENAAYNTNPGETSNILRTKYGYHILKVTDRKKAMGEAEVAHIFIAIPQETSQSDSLSIEEKINNIYKEILDGGNFKELVAKYSDDKASVPKGGALPKFGVNRMVPEFILGISKLENTNDISEPILTNYGWHIIKLLDRQRPGNSDEENEEIKKRLLKDSRADQSKTAIIKKIKKDFKFKEYTKQLDEVIAVVDTTILINKWEKEKAASLNGVLFKLNKDNYTQQKFVDYLFVRQKSMKEGNPEMHIKNAYNDFVNESCILYLDNRLEDIHEDFRLLMEEYRNGILLFELTDEKVWSKAIKDTTGLKEFHNLNKDKYMWSQRLEASIITVNNPELVDEVRMLAAKNPGDDEILEKFNNDTVTNVMLVSGKYEADDNEIMSKIRKEEGLSENIEEGNSITFIAVHAIHAPEPKTLNEAKGLITADYQNYLEKIWLKELKAKYPVHINKKVLARIK